MSFRSCLTWVLALSRGKNLNPTPTFTLPAKSDLQVRASHSLCLPSIETTTILLACSHSYLETERLLRRRKEGLQLQQIKVSVLLVFYLRLELTRAIIPSSHPALLDFSALKVPGPLCLVAFATTGGQFLTSPSSLHAFRPSIIQPITHFAVETCAFALLPCRELSHG